MKSQRRVWVCETLSKRAGRWVVVFAHKMRAPAFEVMRAGRADYPKDKFRVLAYTDARMDDPCNNPMSK